jgi:hypothetical protein
MRSPQKLCPESLDLCLAHESKVADVKLHPITHQQSGPIEPSLHCGDSVESNVVLGAPSIKNHKSVAAQQDIRLTPRPNATPQDVTTERYDDPRGI